MKCHKFNESEPLCKADNSFRYSVSIMLLIIFLGIILCKNKLDILEIKLNELQNVLTINKEFLWKKSN